MTVASLELSKELFEVSAWDGLYKDGFSDDTRNLQRKADGLFPLYDLGYLLRKLPKIVNDTPWEFHPLVEGFGVAYYDIAACFADMPEDAACKLAIELFKQNILKKDDK